MNTDTRYQRAKKKVRELKGFYIHLQVYIMVFIVLLVLPYLIPNFDRDFTSMWGIELWGLGLLAHGCSVFIPNFILGKGWEEKRIEKILNKNHKN